MIILFFGLALVMILVTAYYYHYQNSRDSIGGQISSPKAFWLGYASFNYFVFSVFLYLISENEDLKFILLVVILIFYFRAVVQWLMMFVLHIWLPLYGIIFSLFTVFIIIVLHIRSYRVFEQVDELGVLVLILFQINILLILITDTFYMVKFRGIVGDETKGSKAIWYASKDTKYEAINRLTNRNNKIFAVISILLIVLMVIYEKS